ncbi:thiamine pyrophosphate-dependent enzyme [Jatrophihabitans sp.]|uniref:thiamine pyrophosphate-binding protein n=1 Tax=Jatrophihabitans sp. TaxID=1932789 RepID=UPI0030C766D9|nr:hypothetical protein [Jatrophihabitans sp.]
MVRATISQERSTVDAIVDALISGGVRFVVGMPGGSTVALWGALRDRPEITPVLVSEESVGSYLAEAYGRLTGAPVAVMGQGEWMVGNAGQGYLEALLGASPVLILTEMSDGGAFSHQAHYQAGTGDYGAWDARSALSGVTKRVMVSHHPVQAVHHTQLALKHCLTGEPGPVAVVFSNDSLKGTVGPDSRPPIYSTRPYLPRAPQAVAPSTVAAVAAAMCLAQRPVIIAGNGIRVGQACISLEELARVSDSVVVTTPGGKGVFPEDDPRAAGVIGSFGWPTANEAVRSADLILAVGTKLAASDIGQGRRALIDPERQTLIQIDVEPLNASWTLPMDEVLIGDAGAMMDALTQAIPPDAATTRETAAARILALAPTEGGSSLALQGQVRDGVPIHPRRTIEIINDTIDTLGADTIVTCDAGENRLFMMRWLRSRGRGNYLQPAAGGGMGYALPAALGAKLAYPDRTVLAVCGDGGFTMAMQALTSARTLRLGVVVLVLNNNALGWVLHGDSNAVPVPADDFDFAAIARAMGCDGVRVSCESDLRSALATAGPDRRVPLVIDVPTSLDVSFKDLIQRVRRASAPPVAEGMTP